MGKRFAKTLLKRPAAGAKKMELKVFFLDSFLSLVYSAE